MAARAALPVCSLAPLTHCRQARAAAKEGAAAKLQAAWQAGHGRPERIRKRDGAGASCGLIALRTLRAGLRRAETRRGTQECVRYILLPAAQRRIQTRSPIRLEQRARRRSLLWRPHVVALFPLHQQAETLQQQPALEDSANIGHLHR